MNTRAYIRVDHYKPCPVPRGSSVKRMKDCSCSPQFRIGWHEKLNGKNVKRYTGLFPTLKEARNERAKIMARMQRQAPRASAHPNLMAAYGSLRKAIGDVDAATRTLEDRIARRSANSALRDLYEAEDAIVRALGTL